MPSLHEAQRQFAAALAAMSPLEPGLAVYRRNIAANYRNALGATYPVVKQLVGGDFFDHAVDQFTTAHPSRGGDLNEYGGEFPAFLRRFTRAASLPYLPDVAALEWAVDEAAR